MGVEYNVLLANPIQAGQLRQELVQALKGQKRVRRSKSSASSLSRLTPAPARRC